MIHKLKLLYGFHIFIRNYALNDLESKLYDDDGDYIPPRSMEDDEVKQYTSL